MLLWLVWCLMQPGAPGDADAVNRPPVLYALVFGVPHVVASFFAFGNRRLAQACWRPLALGFFSAATVVALMFLWLDDQLQFGLMIVLTLLHVVGQQTGLAIGQAGLARAGGRRWLRAAAALWKVLLGLLACATALAVGGESLSGPVIPAAPALQVAGWALCASTPLAGALGWAARRQGGDVRAMLAMQATVTVAYGLVMAGQAWLGVLLLRWTHDGTAFVLYGALAVAEDRRCPSANPLWAWLHRCGWRASTRAALILTCIWPLAIALTLVLLLLPTWLGTTLVLAHYFAEPALWRKGSALRQALPLR